MSDIEPPRILIVDDDRLMRNLMREILIRGGFRVIEAEDGQTALGLLETLSGLRVLVTDWHMPGGVDGGRLAVLALRRRPELRVMMVSGAQPQGGDFAAVARFLPKPFMASALLREVGRLIDAPRVIGPVAWARPAAATSH
ncbi:response regulator [Methylobacterium sp. ID0610]|uniref:response regulator n=1 Tax=Methylobacterium carpenticola TaxID=3344827 RepID=UPI00369AA3FF